MTHRGYTLLGWIVWKIGSRVARRKLAANRSKIVAVVAILAVVLVGFALASDDDRD